MKQLLLIFTFLYILLGSTSCEKDITVNLAKPIEKLVVDGRIENGSPAIVYLTKTIPYFSNVNTNSITRYLATNATVTVATDTTNEKLIFDFSRGCYISNRIIGEIGKTYRLTILLEGKTYTSSATIGTPIGFSTVYQTPKNEFESFIHIRFEDPSDAGDSYRYSRITPEMSIFTFPKNSVANDQEHGFNGGSFEFIDGPYKRGNLLKLKISVIDKSAYTFIKQFETEANNNQNPFAAPVSISTNIMGSNVLGCWCGYASSEIIYTVQ